MNMFGLLHLNKEQFVYSINYYIDRIEIITFIAAILCAVPLFKNMLEVKSNWGKIGIDIWLLILFFLSTVMIASSTYNPFIYFRF